MFLQIEIGRYAILSGKTTLQSFNQIPEPRLWVSWLVWIWVLMFLATFFQFSGMIGGIVQILGIAGFGFEEPGPLASNATLAILVTISYAVLLYLGRYKVIEKASTSMIVLFTVFTIFAVFSLYWTDYGITFNQLQEGLSFQLPAEWIIAIAAFGIIGVGATELIYYPYWCIEKGYAKYVGPNDGSDAWNERAAGWIRVLKFDAWVSFMIYTGATIAFYLLGAAVLDGGGISVEDDNLMIALSNLYSTSFGATGLVIFLIGAFIVLYSTIFIATASNARLAADFLRLLNPQKSDEAREALGLKTIRIFCVVFPTLYCVIYIAASRPVTLVTIGAIAQALMLPFLCLTALYYLYKDTPILHKPKTLSLILIWISAALITGLGLYQLVRVFL